MPMYHKEPIYRFHLFYRVANSSEYPWEVHRDTVKGWPHDWVLFPRLPDMHAPSFVAGNPSSAISRKPLSGLQYPSKCN